MFAKLARRLTPVAGVRAGSGPFEPEDGTLPVEARVERLPIEFPPIVRASAGRTFLLGLVELAAAQPPPGPPFDPEAYAALFRRTFAIQATAAPTTDLVTIARQRATARARVALALAGRAVDGVALHRALRPGMTAADLPGALAAGIVPAHVPFVSPRSSATGPGSTPFIHRRSKRGRPRARVHGGVHRPARERRDHADRRRARERPAGLARVRPRAGRGGRAVRFEQRRPHRDPGAGRVRGYAKPALWQNRGRGRRPRQLPRTGDRHRGSSSPSSRSCTATTGSWCRSRNG